MPTEKWKKENQDKVKKARLKWYYKNKEREIKRIVERKNIIVKWFNEYKKVLKCEYCGENNPCCLDFHHKNEKEKDYNISVMSNMGYSINRIKEEIDKCIVLCSNCHRKLHDNGRFK